MKTSQGFTIIEILVAILILAILMTALSMTLTGSLKLNQQSQQQLGTTTDAQRILEDIRSSWSSSTNYDAACAPGLVLPAGYSAKFINLSTRAEPITQNNAPATSTSAAPINDINKNTTCTKSNNALLATTPASVPAMRRIVVQSGTLSGSTQVVGSQDTKLTLDVLRPQ